jgi:hypothetical protein
MRIARLLWAGRQPRTSQRTGERRLPRIPRPPVISSDMPAPPQMQGSACSWSRAAAPPLREPLPPTSSSDAIEARPPGSDKRGFHAAPIRAIERRGGSGLAGQTGHKPGMVRTERLGATGT